MERCNTRGLQSSTTQLGRGLGLVQPEEFEAIAGNGIRATVDGRAVVVGTVRLMQNEGIPAGDLVPLIERMEADGKTTVIVAIDGVEVDDPNAFDYRFAMKAMGGQAQIGVLRSGREIRVAVPLESVPDGPRDERLIRSRSPFSGARVANLSPALADELRLDVTLQGVAIIEVQDGSTARGLGFRKGDLVLAVNGEAIGSSSDLERIAGQQQRVWRITIQRDGQPISVVFGG